MKISGRRKKSLSRLHSFKSPSYEISLQVAFPSAWHFFEILSRKTLGKLTLFENLTAILGKQDNTRVNTGRIKTVLGYRIHCAMGRKWNNTRVSTGRKKNFVIGYRIRCAKGRKRCSQTRWFVDIRSKFNLTFHISFSNVYT